MQEESYDRKSGRTADGGHVLCADGAAAGIAVRHGDRRMDGAVYGGAGPSGTGDAVYHLGAFSGGGLHSGDVGAGTAAELSVDGEGAAGVPE